MNSITIARREAAGIDKIPAVRPLRVHVSGDCRNKTTAKIVGSAMVRYEHRARRVRDQKGRPVRAWTYTHAWRDVHAKHWQGANVVASIEAVNQIEQARSMGYKACAMVRPRDQHRPTVRVDGLLLVECPWERSKRYCKDCQLCADVDWFTAHNALMTFTSHGALAAQADDQRGGCYAYNYHVRLAQSGATPKVVQVSQSKGKIHGMAVTYANIKRTCPTSCAFYPIELRS